MDLVSPANKWDETMAGLTELLVMLGFGLIIGSLITLFICGSPRTPSPMDKDIKIEMLSRELVEAKIELRRRGQALDNWRERERNKSDDKSGDWWKTGDPNPLGDCS